MTVPNTSIAKKEQEEAKLQVRQADRQHPRNATFKSISLAARLIDFLTK